MPKFSIVIPTKNRPDYLKASIYSALNQSFNDLEVIVSDNHNDERTQEVLNSFSDQRFRVVKPDVEMNMPDHWEFATRHAKGEFVLLLADRKVLYANALQRMMDDPNLNRLNAAAVGVKVYDDQKGHMGWNVPIVDSQWFSVKDLLEDFLGELYFNSISKDSCYPKTLNGIYRNSHAANIRDRAGAYFNIKDSITPDYSSFFANSATNTQTYFFGFPVILTQGEASSHGRKFGKGDYSYYMDSLNVADPYSYVPLKAPFIYTLLYQDFFAVRHALGGSLLEAEPDWENYFACNYSELQLKLSSDILKREKKEEFESEFKRALLAVMENETVASKMLEKFSHQAEGANASKSDWAAHIRDHINYRYSHIGVVNRIMKYRFPSVLAAAGFK